MKFVSGKKIKTLLLVVLIYSAITVFSASSLLAIGRWGCLGVGAAEYVVPGLGYGILGQWDKALLFGGTRWVAMGQVVDNRKSDYYQTDMDQIYKTTSKDDSESGKDETRVYLNKETWTVKYYSNIYSNMLMTSWGDLYQNGCRQGPEDQTYSLMLSPFRFDHFYKKWTFWLPMVFLAGNYSMFSDYSKVEYHLNRGLKESDLKNNAFLEYYTVGLGEEMFFRGTVQRYFFEIMKDSWDFSPQVSRYLSIVGASAVFAAAHSGQGFSANPAGAFLFGLYEGFVYHPSLEEFDLMTAIAIHSWWDIVIAYTILNHADFYSADSDVKIPLLSVSFPL